MKEELKKFYSFCKKNKYFIIFCFIISYFTYFIRLNNYSVSIDNEYPIKGGGNVFNGVGNSWISIRRWALVLLTYVVRLGDRFNPFYSNLVCLFFFNLFVILVSYLFYKYMKNNKYIIYIFGSAILTSPLYADQFCFTLQNAEVAIGLCLVALATYLSFKAVYENNIASYIMGTLVLAFSMGIYQAMYIVYITLVVGLFFAKISTEKSSNIKKEILNILKFITIFVIAHIITTIIANIFINVLNLNGQNLLTTTTWKRCPTRMCIKIIKNTLIREIFPTGLFKVYNYSYLISIVLTLLIIASMIKNKENNKVLKSICLIFLLLTPFLLIFIQGDYVPNRTMLSYSIVVAIIFTSFINRFKEKDVLTLILIITTITGISQLKVTNDYFYSDLIRYKEDEKLTYEIFYSIESLDNLPSQKLSDCKIIFLGKYKTKSPGDIYKGDTVGSSFYGWDYETEFLSNRRINSFAQIYGYKYIMPSVEEIQNAKQYIDELNVFPEKGSITIKDNIIIVRLR